MVSDSLKKKEEANALSRRKGASMVKDFLMSDREGAEVFEYVLIVALLVALIVVLFKTIGPIFLKKMQDIGKDVSTSGASMMGIGA